jgi:hypothetical protein
MDDVFQEYFQYTTVEEMEVKLCEKEAERDTGKCYVMISKVLLNQPSVVLPGEMVSNASGLMYEEIRGVLKVFLENVIHDAINYNES